MVGLGTKAYLSTKEAEKDGSPLTSALKWPSNPSKYFTLDWTYSARVNLDVVLSVLLDGLLFCQAYCPNRRVRENHSLQSQVRRYARKTTIVSVRVATV